MRRFAQSLAGRLLGLTALFVLVAEVLILAPSLASFQAAWLEDRLNRTQLAAQALAALPQERAAAGSLMETLRVQAGVLSVAERRGPLRRVWGGDPEAVPDREIDLRRRTLGGDILAVFETLSGPPGRSLRAIGPAGPEGGVLEAVIDEGRLAADLRGYARQVLIGSIFISLISATLLYATLLRMFVRPMRELTHDIEAFAARPDDASIAIRPSARDDEIGRAEAALSAMQDQVRAALRQRERLAALGAAMAKIAHDMRASLATAHLVGERLAASDDPKVAQIAQRLTRSIDRAGALAETALRYGRADEPSPNIARLSAQAALEDAAAEALAPFPAVIWRNGAASGVAVLGDVEHTHRILANLIRNAAQAIARQAERTSAGVVAATATIVGERVLIRIVDDGPGLPEAARARLFEPFAAAASDGAGLGLAIARELARAQGGELRLVGAGPEGTAFELDLRAAPDP